MNCFASRMKNFREKQKLSVQELADHAGLSRSMIYKIESQETQPSLEIALRIAKALNTSLTHLIDEESNQESRVIRSKEIPKWIDSQTGLTRLSLIITKNKNEWLRMILPKNKETREIPALLNKSGYIYLLSGKAEIHFEKSGSILLLAGDLCLIPEKIKHNLKNIGKSKCEFFVLLENK